VYFIIIVKGDVILVSAWNCESLFLRYNTYYW